jgi:hypothetical protein
VGENKQADGGAGRQLPRLPGGEVPVPGRETGVVIAEGGLGNQEVDAVGQFSRTPARLA